jgi:NAD-dependent DNA ligase
MRDYLLKNYLPTWHLDPATIRQQKVLRFFGVPINPLPSKGRAGGIIGRLFSDPANKHLWTAYVYTTNDQDASSSELMPHSHAVLEKIVIPDDWRPRNRSTISGEKRNALEALVGDLLAEGSPFDDPLPEIEFEGKCFAFTGRFDFGSRKACQEAVLSRGGLISDGVTSMTDVLVVGSDANPTWSHGSYGNKIQAAMVKRMHHGKPVIIPEAFWKSLLEG